MATHIRNNAPINTAVDTIDAISAGLESDPETADLAPTWVAMTERADALAEERRRLEREVRRTRARVSVTDSMWDATIAAFGRAVVDASGGRRDEAPYTRFFAKTLPSKAQNFGVAREIEIGRTWQVELTRNPEEPLAEAWTSRLQASTDALDTAQNERTAAVKAMGSHQTSVMLFIDDVNRELDRLEGDLRKRFAGQTQRVSAYLSSTRPNPRRPDDSLDTPPPEAD